MIAYTYIHSAQLERIKGVFNDIDVMVMKCKITDRIDLTDNVFGPSIRQTVLDRILVVRSDDLDRIDDRCEDFGIKGFRWSCLYGMQYGSYCYKSQSGDICFLIGTMRKQRRFEPNLIAA